MVGEDFRMVDMFVENSGDSTGVVDEAREMVREAMKTAGLWSCG
jgi:hypothetical protein